MLPADGAVAQRDPDLPGLATVLDDGALTELVRAHWSSSPRPHTVTVGYMRYKPATMLLAAATIYLDGQTHPALIATAGSSNRAKLQKIVEYGERHPGAFPVMVDTARALVIAPLSADRRLPGVDRIEERLERFDSTLVGGDLTVLSYKPHRRLVLRVDVDDEPRAVVKIHGAGGYDGAVAALQWAQTQRSERIWLPPLLGADPKYRAVATEWMPGIALDDHHPKRRRSVERSVGKLLGRLHRRDLGRLAAQTDTKADRVEFVTAIGRLSPDLGAIARQVVENAPKPAGRCTAVHGDLSADQVVANADGVGLIDLDRTGVGYPANDLASWVSAAVTYAPLGRWREHCELPAALLEGYRSVRGPATDADIRGQVPVELLRRATDPFRLRMPDWPERMSAIVSAAAHVQSMRAVS